MTKTAKTHTFLYAIILCTLRPVLFLEHMASLPLLAPVDVYDFVLVDELEYVGRVHEDAHGPDGGDEEEDPELGPVHHHRNKLPVLSDLKWK